MRKSAISIATLSHGDANHNHHRISIADGELAAGVEESRTLEKQNPSPLPMEPLLFQVHTTSAMPPESPSSLRRWVEDEAAEAGVSSPPLEGAFREKKSKKERRSTEGPFYFRSHVLPPVFLPEKDTVASRRAAYVIEHEPEAEAAATCGSSSSFLSVKKNTKTGYSHGTLSPSSSRAASEAHPSYSAVDNNTPRREHGAIEEAEVREGTPTTTPIWEQLWRYKTITCLHATPQHIGVGTVDGDIMLYTKAAADVGADTPLVLSRMWKAAHPNRPVMGIDEAGAYLVSVDNVSGLLIQHMGEGRSESCWRSSLWELEKRGHLKDVTDTPTSATGGTAPRPRRSAGPASHSNAPPGGSLDPTRRWSGGEEIRNVALHPCYDGTARFPLVCSRGTQLVTITAPVQPRSSTPRDPEERFSASVSSVGAIRPGSRDTEERRHPRTHSRSSLGRSPAGVAPPLFPHATTRPLSILYESSKHKGPILQVRWRPRAEGSASWTETEVSEWEEESCLAWMTAQEAVVFHFRSRRVLRSIPFPNTAVPRFVAVSTNNSVAHPHVQPSPPRTSSEGSQPSGGGILKRVFAGAAFPSRSSSPARPSASSPERRAATAAGVNTPQHTMEPSAKVVLPEILSLQWESASSLLLNWGIWLQQVDVQSTITTTTELLSPNATPPPANALRRHSTGPPGYGGGDGSSFTHEEKAPPTSRSGTGMVGQFIGALVRPGAPAMEVIARLPQPWRRGFYHSSVKRQTEEDTESVEEERVLSLMPYGPYRYVVVTAVHRQRHQRDREREFNKKGTKEGPQSYTRSSTGSLGRGRTLLSDTADSTQRSSEGHETPSTRKTTPPSDFQYEVASEIRVYIVERETLQEVYQTFIETCVAVPFQVAFACGLGPSTGLNFSEKAFPASSLCSSPGGELFTPPGGELFTPPSKAGVEREKGMISEKLSSVAAHHFLQTHFPPDDTQYVLCVLHSVFQLEPPCTVDKIRHLLYLNAPQVRTSEEGEAEMSWDVPFHHPQHPLRYVDEGFWMAWAQRHRFVESPTLRSVTLEAIQWMLHLVEQATRDNENGSDVSVTNAGNTTLSAPTKAQLWDLVTQRIALFLENADVALEAWPEWLRTYDRAGCIWRLAEVLPEESLLRIHSYRLLERQRQHPVVDEREADLQQLPQSYYHFVLLRCLKHYPSCCRQTLRRCASQVNLNFLQQATAQAIVLRQKEQQQRQHVTNDKNNSVERSDDRTEHKEEEKEDELREVLDVYGDLLLLIGSEEEAFKVMLFNKGSTLLFPYVEARPPLSFITDYARHLHLNDPERTVRWLLRSTCDHQQGENAMQLLPEKIAKLLSKQDRALLWAYLRALPLHDKSESALRIIQLHPFFYAQLCLEYGTPMEVLRFLQSYAPLLHDFADALYVLCCQKPGLTEARVLLLARLGREQEGLELLIRTLRSVQLGLSYIQNLPPLETVSSARSRNEKEECRRSALFRWLVDVAVKEHTQLVASEEICAGSRSYAVVHFTSPEDTFESVAERYGVTAAAIREATLQDSHFKKHIHRPHLMAQRGRDHEAGRRTSEEDEYSSVEGSSMNSEKTDMWTAVHTLQDRKETKTSHQHVDPTPSQSFALSFVTRKTPGRAEDLSPSLLFYVVPSTLLTALLVGLSLSSPSSVNENGVTATHASNLFTSVGAKGGRGKEGGAVVAAVTDLQYLLSRLPDFHSIQHIGPHLAALAAHWAAAVRFHAAVSNLLHQDVQYRYVALERQRMVATRVDPTSTSCPSCLLPLLTERDKVVLFHCGHCYHSACVPQSTAEETARRRRERHTAIGKWYGVGSSQPYAAALVPSASDIRRRAPYSPEDSALEDVVEEDAMVAITEPEAEHRDYPFCGVCSKRKLGVYSNEPNA